MESISGVFAFCCGNGRSSAVSNILETDTAKRDRRDKRLLQFYLGIDEELMLGFVHMNFKQIVTILTKESEQVKIGNQLVAAVPSKKVQRIFRNKESDLLPKFISVDFFQAGGDEYKDLLKLQCFCLLFATTSSPQTKGEYLHELLLQSNF